MNAMTAAEDREFLQLVGEERPATTWAPLPLDEILAGEHTEAVPTMLARSDGPCLLYRKRAHAFHAEPEALKTWLALGAAAERIAAGEAVLYIDFEDSAPSIVQRLAALGVDPNAIRARFVYIRPDEPLADAALQDLERALDALPTLAVIDGLTEAFSQNGLNPLDNTDVAAWLELLPRKLIRGGAAVLQLDHVVKDREQRGRYAIGAQHKLAGIDVAYSMHVIEPFSRGHAGLVSIRVEKDRPGGVRLHQAPDKRIALLRASSHGGHVCLTLDPPETKPASSFRPTVLMERISLAVEANPGLSKRAIRETVRGKTSACDLALELLVSEGYIEPRRDSQATRHYPMKPYREPATTPTVTP